MNVAIFSDLHAHPFKPYATVLKNGMNSRLADAVSCVDQILDVCVQRDVDLVLFGGDLFHVRRNINVVAFNAVYEALAKFHMHGIPVAMIHGNHDQADRYGEEHSIHAFRTYCTVFDKPGWQIVTGKSGIHYNILGIPYTENLDKLRDITKQNPPGWEGCMAPKIMLAHLGIQGAKVGADFVYTNQNDASLSDLNLDAFDACYLGHYHLHQQLADNCWYIGAPLQHNWGDRDQWRGFVLYDSDSHTHELVSLNAPKFVTLTDNQKFQSDSCKDDYVRIVDHKRWTEEEKAIVKDSVGARSVEIVAPDCVKNTSQGPRIDVSEQTSINEAMQKYVQSGVHPSDGLDAQYLMRIGTEILEELEQDGKA